MTIKRNIWSLFYFVLMGGIFLFLVLSYSRYKDIEDDYHQKYRYFTGIISQSAHSRFAQDEFILEVLGIQLLTDKQYQDTMKTQKFFDDLLKKNPTLAGFGLVNTDGDFVSASSNVNLSKMPNLLKDSHTEESFKSALVSDKMVLGRTFYVAGMDEWVIMLYKSIRNTGGEVIGVLATGLILDHKNSFLNKMDLPDVSVFTIVKDFNAEGKMYRQFTNHADIELLTQEEVYDVPVPLEIYQAVGSNIKDKYGISMEDLKVSGETVSFELTDQWNRHLLMSLMFDETYQLWCLVQVDFSIVRETFMKSLVTYFFVFMLSFFIIFMLFKRIARLDKIKRDELLFQVMHDPLTQLPNRTYLYKHWEEMASHPSQNIDMLFIDLDNFKNINDGFGHRYGDAILVQVAQRLRSFFNEQSLVVRQGGDEFIILMPCHEENREQTLNKLIEFISQPYLIENIEFSIGLSIGTAQYPKDAQNIESLMSLADTAMFEAKKRKNVFCIFSSEMQSRNLRKVDIEHELRSGMKKDEFKMVYQPQINADGTVHGVEALIRWENARLGFVPPDQFISVAEDTGLMPKLGDFIIQRSLQEIYRLQSEMKMRFQLSINISVRQLIEIDFLDKLLNEIKICGLERSLITLEITENLFIEDIEDTLPLLMRIKEKGLGISLDDFGTGYSSLNILRRLPINELKIDKSFVDDILTVKEDSAMAKSIIEMGKNLSMHTLAEGVETIEQANLLREFDCDIFQGYYYSKPLSIDDLAKFFKAF